MDEFKEHQLVSLTKSFPDLPKGTVGTIVYMYEYDYACEVEFVTDMGSETVTLLLTEIEPHKG